MFWEADYCSHMTKNNKAHGKKKILRKILKTLERSPYEIANLYKYSGDKKIFVGSYRFDEDAWDDKGIRRLRMI